MKGGDFWAGKVGPGYRRTKSVAGVATVALRSMAWSRCVARYLLRNNLRGRFCVTQVLSFFGFPSPTLPFPLSRCLVSLFGVCYVLPVCLPKSHHCVSTVTGLSVGMWSSSTQWNFARCSRSCWCFSPLATVLARDEGSRTENWEPKGLDQEVDGEDLDVLSPWLLSS